MSAQGARDLKHDSFVEFLEDDISEGQIDKIHFGRCPRQAYRSSNRDRTSVFLQAKKYSERVDGAQQAQQTD